MSRRRNPLITWTLTNITLAFAKLTQICPLAVDRFLARILARIGYYAIPKIRKIGLANLDLAYGDTLTKAEKVRILKRSTESLVTVACEFSHVPYLSEDFIRENISFEGLEHVDPSQGQLFIGAHLGNWEWAACAMRIKGFRPGAVVRPFDDPRLNAYVDKVRDVGGMHVIPKAKAAGGILSAIRDGYSLGVMVDQSPRENGAPVTFFGQPCWGTIAPVMIALRARIPIVASVMYRNPDGRYTLSFSAPVNITRTGDLRRDILENTQRCQDMIEETIRRYPEQWLWQHRRWKARPKLEKEWEERKKRDKKEPSF